MKSALIQKDKRKQIVIWHATVALDGNDNKNAAWKRRLANKMGVSPATISNMISTKRDGTPRSSSETTKEKLEQLDDRTFLELLGFVFKTPDVNDPTWSRLTGALPHCLSENDYADLCLAAGIPLKAEAEKQARARKLARQKREQDRLARWRTPEKAYQLQRNLLLAEASPATALPMHEAEENAVKELFKVLLGGAHPTTTIVYSVPYSGVSYALERLLPQEENFNLHYAGGVHHLYMDALRNRDDLRIALRDNICPHTTDSNLLAKRIAEVVCIRKQLIIVHGATEYPAENKKFLDYLSDELESAMINKKLGYCSRLILTSWNEGSFNYLNNRKRKKFEFNPTIEGKESLYYFEKCLRYYVDLRIRLGHLPNNHDGNFIVEAAKAIEHHYSRSEQGHTNLPSAVRFRAFCASDLKAQSPFDPTEGLWHRVPENLRDKIPEIAGCLGDVQSDIRTFSDEAPATGDLSSLRVASTGLFFFSDRMLDRLKHDSRSNHFVAYVDFDSSRLRNKFYLRRVNHRSGRSNIVMPLLVRTLIQDDWLRFDDKGGRQAIHEVIADELFRMANVEADSALAEELPYKPPRGQARIPLALESIRHYMRAAQSTSWNPNKDAAEEQAKNLTKRALEVYSALLGGDLDTRAGSDRQLISRASGLSSLKYEVLCLLSEDGNGVSAPRGVSNEVRCAFFRELGISLSRMLRPLEAIEAFDRALAIREIKPSNRAYVIAHAITAQLLLGNAEAARSLLEQCRLLEVAIENEGDDPGATKSRNDAREAAICLAEGKRDQSRHLWTSIANDGLVAYSSDRAIGFIDTLLSLPFSQGVELNMAWQVAERAISKSQTEGHDNERLQISVRRATIVRRLGHPEVAEAILDAVGLDLGSNGGSELLFREFQLESSATLAALGRPRYAFAAYAWPSFNALKRTGARPWIDRARDHCLSLLKSGAVGDTEKEPSNQHPFWKQSEESDQRIEHPFFSIDILPSFDEVIRVWIDLNDNMRANKYLEELSII